MEVKLSLKSQGWETRDMSQVDVLSMKFNQFYAAILDERMPEFTFPAGKLGGGTLPYYFLEILFEDVGVKIPTEQIRGRIAERYGRGFGSPLERLAYQARQASCGSLTELLVGDSEGYTLKAGHNYVWITGK